MTLEESHVPVHLCAGLFTRYPLRSYVQSALVTTGICFGSGGVLGLVSAWENPMKRLLAAVLVVLATVTGTAAPAAAYSPDPADISGTRFYTYSICVSASALNATEWPVAAIAQRWNVASSYVLRLQYKDDCAAAGYPPSRRFLIGVNFNSTGCYDALYTNRTLGTGGMYLWTNEPFLRINAGSSSCTGTQARRNHAISATIGAALGLRALNSSGWNSRVMNNTAYSWDNVQYPTAIEGERVAELYLNWYGGN